jgi:hypothetical protein
MAEIQHWDPRRPRSSHSWDVNYQKRKSVTSMEREQRDVIQFLHVKGLKLDEIATELSMLMAEMCTPL